MDTASSTGPRQLEIKADGTLSNTSDGATSPDTLRLLVLTLDVTLCATFTDEHWEAFDETVATFPDMDEVRFTFGTEAQVAEQRAAGLETKLWRLRAAGKLKLGVDPWRWSGCETEADGFTEGSPEWKSL